MMDGKVLGPLGYVNTYFRPLSSILYVRVANLHEAVRITTAC